MDKRMGNLPSPTNESIPTYLSSSKNGDEFLANQVNHSLNNTVSKDDFENHFSTQKSGETEDRDITIQTFTPLCNIVNTKETEQCCVNNDSVLKGILPQYNYFGTYRNGCVS